MEFLFFENPWNTLNWWRFLWDFKITHMVNLPIEFWQGRHSFWRDEPYEKICRSGRHQGVAPGSRSSAARLQQRLWSHRDCWILLVEYPERSLPLHLLWLTPLWPDLTSFRFTIVAYNLMSLFRHFALNHHNRATLKTLRVYCFALGAWTVNHANRKVLKISLPVKKMAWMDGRFSHIQNSSPPFNYPNA